MIRPGEQLLGGRHFNNPSQIHDRHAICEVLDHPDLLDPQTGRSRVRGVDIDSDSYANAFALQERIFAEDLEDRSRLASIAEAANLSPEEARERYAPR